MTDYTLLTPADIITTTPQAIITLGNSALDRNPAAVYLAGLSTEPGRRAQRQALAKIAELLGYDDLLTVDWAALRFQHTTAIRSKLVAEYKPATVNRMLCALRGTLKAAWRLGIMTAEDYHRAADVQAATGQTLPAGRSAASGELAAILRACENDITPAGARDAAMIAIAYICGLRRAELVGVDLGDYNDQTGELRIMGKRRKERIVYPAGSAAQALADWLAIRGGEPGPLFYPINKGGRLAARRMTSQAYYNILQNRIDAAGVKDLSPHDLRRTCASDLLDAGVDIATVAKLLGHASVTTTQRYDRRPEAAKRKAAGLLHIPYRGRLVR